MTQDASRPALMSVAHAVPPHRMLQADAEAAARGMFSHRYAAFERMAPVFTTAGIEQRYTVKPLDWYLTDLGWPERNAAYLAGAQELFVDAATRALAGNRLQPGTPQFRAALRDAIFSTKEVVGAHGVYNFKPGDLYGVDSRARVMVRVENGQWKLAP